MLEDKDVHQVSTDKRLSDETLGALGKAIFSAELICPLACALFACCVATFFSWECLGWAGHTNEYFFIPPLNHLALAACCVLVMLLAIYCVAKKIAPMAGRSGTVRKVALIYAMALLARLFYLSFADDAVAPFSDFAQTWGLANGDLSSLPYKSLFAAWMNFATMERLFVTIFGSNYHRYLVVNCMVGSCSAPLVYGIARQMLAREEKSERAAIMGGLIYALYPASALFSTIAAPDVYVVPLYLAGALVLLRLLRRDTYGLRDTLGHSLLAGVFFGASASLKSFGIVPIIAFSLIAVFGCLGRLRRFGRWRLLLVVLSIACLMGAYTGVKRASLHLTEIMFDTKLDYSTATPHYLLVGLNTEGEGQIHIGGESRLYYRKILDEGMTTQQARKQTLELLRNDWLEHRNRVLPLFVKKMIWAWQNDTVPSMYYRTYVIGAPDSFIDRAVFGGIASLSQVSYLCIVIGAMIALGKLNTGSGCNARTVLIGLVIIGYFCVVLLSEAQSRYKYLIMPLLCAQAGIGFSTILEASIRHIKNWIGRKKCQTCCTS